jgi:hypothetical protein
MIDPMRPDPEGFAADPIGYSSLAWTKWAMVKSMKGWPGDPFQPPTSEDLKDPFLWLCQARALQQAAIVVFKDEPTFAPMPTEALGVCDSQYRAVGLMLVGYSLEICLKAMIILRDGIEAYTAAERALKHHRLVELAAFLPDLTTQDKGILEALTHFIYWAGRYPDPGSGRMADSEARFKLSEAHRISARDLFALAGRIMQKARDYVP